MALLCECEAVRERGHRGLLRGATFLAPARTRKGNGRVTAQFGVSYVCVVWLPCSFPSGASASSLRRRDRRSVGPALNRRRGRGRHV